jgi:hypothetical protein
MSMLEAMRMKLRVQWRPKEVRDARNVKCLQRKAAVMEQSQHKERPCGCQMARGGSS